MLPRLVKLVSVPVYMLYTWRLIGQVPTSIIGMFLLLWQTRPVNLTVTNHLPIPVFYRWSRWYSWSGVALMWIVSCCHVLLFLMEGKIIARPWFRLMFAV